MENLSKKKSESYKKHENLGPKIVSKMKNSMNGCNNEKGLEGEKDDKLKNRTYII